MRYVLKCFALIGLFALAFGLLLLLEPKLDQILGLPFTLDQVNITLSGALGSMVGCGIGHYAGFNAPKSLSDGKIPLRMVGAAVCSLTGFALFFLMGLSDNFLHDALNWGTCSYSLQQLTAFAVGSAVGSGIGFYFGYADGESATQSPPSGS